MNRPILIIEDEENDVFFLRRALLKAGVREFVHSVSNGQQALDYLAGVGDFTDRVSFPFPAFVFLDLKLPRVHGLEVLRKVRSYSTFPSPVVIVLTSSVLPADIAQSYYHGANSYVVKPSDPDKLFEMARSFVQWWFHFTEAVPAGGKELV